jgi:hypothetical protein
VPTEVTHITEPSLVSNILRVAADRSSASIADQLAHRTVTVQTVRRRTFHLRVPQPRYNQSTAFWDVALPSLEAHRSGLLQ